MSKKRPYIVTILGDYNILSAFLLILTFFPIAKILGITAITPEYLDNPDLIEKIIKGLIAISIIVISLGYLKLKKWGYWLLICENLLSLLGWFITYRLNGQSHFTPLPLSSIIELIFVVPTIKYFYINQINSKLS